MRALVAAVLVSCAVMGAVWAWAEQNGAPVVAQEQAQAVLEPGGDTGDITAEPAEGTVEAPAELPEALAAPPAAGMEKPGAAEERPPEPPTAPPQPLERTPGEVINGSFEKELDGWQTAPGAKPTVEADPAAAKSGKLSARLSAPRPEMAAWLAQDIPLLGRPGQLEVSYWVRPTLGGPVRIVAKLEFLDAAGGKVMTRYLQHVGRDPRKWQQASGEVQLPAAVTMLRLTLRLVGAGAAWVDDVAVKFRPQGLLVWPRRLACVEGQACTVELDLWASPDGALAAKIDDQTEVTLSVDGQRVKAEVGPLPIGRHVLTITAGEEKDAVEVWTVPGSRRPRMVSETGFWLIKQKLALVSLLHHASLPDLAELTAHGFSAAEILAPESPDGLSRLLRSVPKQLAPLVVSFPLPSPGAEEDWRGRVLQTIRAGASEQRIAGWLIASEPDAQLGSAFLPQVYLDARKTDGLHPLVVTLAGAEEVVFWGAFADVVLINCCALGEDVARLAEVLRQARSKLEAWQVLGAMLPAGWGPGTFQPDATRAKVLAFSAVAGGASVLSWYALRATGWDLRASAAWPAFRDLNQALGKLSDATAGRPPAEDVVVTGEGILWRAWGDGDTRIVLLVNPTGAAVTVVVRASQAALTEPASLVYEAKPTATAGGVSVSLQPGAVAVVKAKLGPPGAPEAGEIVPQEPAPQEPESGSAPPVEGTQIVPEQPTDQPQVEPAPPSEAQEQPEPPEQEPQAQPLPPAQESQEMPDTPPAASDSASERAPEETP
ncbi:MAG: hypothetical protein N2512_07735 [Armatimonadetes bacterium]|nr:hypothetical protein [Armatimonadota bacterium]